MNQHPTIFLHTDSRGEEVSLGGKAQSLWVLGKSGFSVPPWLAVLPPDSGDVALTTEIAHDIQTQLHHLDKTITLWAVRSSAADEDRAEHSFAGQLDSFLNVPLDEVPSRIMDVRRSGFSERILAYRQERGIYGPPTCPTVIVQAMVPADTAGVAFSADAVSGRWDIAVVGAVRGLGDALVSGMADADTYRVDEQGSIIDRQLVDSARPIVNDPHIIAIAALARQTATHYGRPQDIEWAMAGGDLYLLQSRPITTLDLVPDPRGVRMIWDNSNIAESYCGVTTPLTYSYARYIYEEVYWQFCRMLGVSEKKLMENSDIFGRMLGLVRGRIYYSLMDWYRALALLPGFTFNRRFMEQMMGVKEGLPDDLARQFEHAGTRAKLGDLLHLFSTVMGILASRRKLPRIKREFGERLDHALKTPAGELKRLRADELVLRYRELERQLLARWDVPMVNDFLAMIYFGVLRSLCSKWLASEFLANDLVGGSGGMVSTEPARRVEEMANVARRHPKLARILCEAPTTEALVAARTNLEFSVLLESYLEKFGDRCLEELKLESPSLRDDPAQLIRSIGRLAVQPPAPPRARYEAREQAEVIIQQKLARHPFRRWLFLRVLNQTRMYVRDRENLRLDRTRLFAYVRTIFTELGRRFCALNRLDDHRDVFYLTVPEILGFVEGTAASTELRSLVALRRSEFDTFRNTPPPADRFETFGTVYVGNPFRGTARESTERGDTRTGTACCPGIVRGIARVVIDPHGVELTPGEILVASRTDPGWVMLFPSAAGLVVEHGSLLSHSAIVARELGLPAVIGVSGVTSWLTTGDEIELNGATGTVRRLTEHEVAHAQ